MLTEKDLNNYKSELDAQLVQAQQTLEQAKANLHAVIGAQQALAHLMSINCEEDGATDAEQHNG